MKQQNTSLMSAEAAETPTRFRQQRLALEGTLEDLSTKLRDTSPKMAITCGRGSSDHAGVFTRYLIEKLLKIPTASATPSTLSVYGVAPNLKGCLVVLISQSGQSPDLISYAQAAQRSGALTVGLINQHTDAPLAEQLHTYETF